MKYVTAVFLFLSGMIFFSPSSEAKHQITKRVAKGKPTFITDNFSCNGGLVPAKISEQPKNGTAEIVVVREAVNAKKLNAKSVGCEGTVVDIHYVRYTPKAGYTGPDEIGVDWGSNIFGGTTNRYKITVGK